MIDYSGLPFSKGESRADHKRARQAAAKRADDAARAIAWIRCGGRCERCGARIKRGGGLLDGAEFNHTTAPKDGGRRVPQGQYLCHTCHQGASSGGHRRRLR